MSPFLFENLLMNTEFIYPAKYLDFASEKSSILIEPWFILFADEKKSLHYNRVLQKKFPESFFIPFALNHDISGFWNDGWPVLACFDAKNSLGEVYIYDFENPTTSPYNNFSYDTFLLWLNAANEESKLYKEERNIVD